MTTHPEQMITPEYLKNTVGWIPDKRWKNWWLEVKAGVHNVRDLRATLVGLAYVAKLDPMSQIMCILIDSRITAARIGHEIELFRSSLEKDIAPRIHVITRLKSGIYSDHHFDLPLDVINDVINDELGKSNKRPKGTSQYTVFGQLLINWLRNTGPQPVESICKASGASYPTVAAVLKQLDDEGVIKRDSNRSVTLRAFPREQWRRWVNESIEARKTTSFVDQSGLPRAPEDLVRRLQRLDRGDIGIGGVLGAKHYYPQLDLSGTPRLDLTVHGSSNTSLDFVNALDPALEKSNERHRTPTLVIHFLFRTDASFECDTNGNVWADPFECLVDLHEAHFDMQADDMLYMLINNRKKSSLNG